MFWVSGFCVYVWVLGFELVGLLSRMFLNFWVLGFGLLMFMFQSCLCFVFC